MQVFISHDFDDKAEFDNVADALEAQAIEVWKPEVMTAGSSLSEQLRQSILKADLCVFVATRNSVQSNWCGAELGAFWGIDKPVIIYIAETTLKDDALPRQFRGHLTERRISRVVDAVKSRIDQVKQAGSAQDKNAKVSTLAEMSYEDLKLLISEAITQAQNFGLIESNLIRLADAVPSEGKVPLSEIEHIQGLLIGLLGVRSMVLTEVARRTEWKYGFEFITDTGRWLGHGKTYWNPDELRGNAPVDIISPCLVWRYGNDHLVEAVGLLPSVTDHNEWDIVELKSPIVLVGRGSLGKLIRKDANSQP